MRARVHGSSPHDILPIGLSRYRCKQKCLVACVTVAVLGAGCGRIHFQALGVDASARDGAPSDSGRRDGGAVSDGGPADGGVRRDGCCDPDDAGGSRDGGPGTLPDAGVDANAGTDAGADAATDGGPVAVCGNGTVEPGEECDDGDADNTDGCLETCVFATCGDGHVRAGVEECDDGNTSDGDGCSALCSSCSDGDASFTWTGNSHCYTRFDVETDWGSARNACGSVGGHLVTFSSSSEENAVVTNIGYGPGPWLGAHDRNTEGSFQWITGEPMTYTNWDTGEPNNMGDEDCVVRADTRLGWNDFGCTNVRFRFCENEGWALRPADNHAYKVIYGQLSWSDARAECSALGGHLASVTSSGEQSFVASLTDRKVWLGGHDRSTEGSYEWVTGESFSHTAWAPGEPDDSPSPADCIVNETGGWADDACTALYGYVCEVD